MAVRSDFLRCSSPDLSIREDVGSSIVAVIPPRTSSLRSFTIFCDPDSESNSHTTISNLTEQDIKQREQIQPYELPEQPILPLQYTEFSYVTWDPPQLYVPPPQSPSAQAQTEPFPEYIDPANNLILARTLLLDKLHFRATSPEHHASRPLPGRPFESVFSRIVPDTGFLREQQDLTRERSSIVDILQAGEALRAQRAGGNKAKKAVLSSLRGSGSCRGASNSGRDLEPKDVLRHKLKKDVRYGMEMALQWEQEFGWSFLDHQSESESGHADDVRDIGERAGRSSRERTRRAAARRPPGVTRGEVRVALEMLRQSLPGFYPKVDTNANKSKSKSESQSATKARVRKDTDKSGVRLRGSKSGQEMTVANHRSQPPKSTSTFVEKRNGRKNKNNPRSSSLAFEPVGVVYSGPGRRVDERRRRGEKSPQTYSTLGRRRQRGSGSKMKEIVKKASAMLRRVAAGFGLRQPSASASASASASSKEKEKKHDDRSVRESVKRQGFVDVPRGCYQASTGVGEKEYAVSSGASAAPPSSPPSGQSSSGPGWCGSGSGYGSASSRRSPSPSPSQSPSTRASISPSTSSSSPPLLARSESSSLSSFETVTVSDIKRINLTRPSEPARVVGNNNSARRVMIKKPAVAVAAAANKLQKPRKTLPLHHG
ncbi:hypothetical protein H2202_001665 [Exophiala xenobiotica]|nr:hypothetical protein H2202_001665 [Exophiala xenobiotica]KAK5228306.1 hypothetical protein LTR72_002189 [Exophiala xenobiotica]KAK5302257.1 hypothetical protein LTR14_000506 [Exophiala xenobiotica]KAK5409855.1 hypothetical protein LTR06_006321 [Exophiala xenobiotica]KAK5487365.1 hypothetical protein LTR55_004736 [Exophiala xenobiotica]